MSQLIVRSQRLSWIQVLNCQNCSQCLKCHKSLGLLLWGVLWLCPCICLCICLCNFFLVMSCLLITEQMSQRSQVSRIALRRCSQNVFVFVNFFVMSCLLITLNKCLKGHKSLGLLWGGVLKMSLSLSLSLYFLLVWVSDWVTRSPIELLWTDIVAVYCRPNSRTYIFSAKRNKSSFM